MNKIRRPEKALQSQTRQALGYLGYDSLETGSARKKVACKCPKCGHGFMVTPSGWQGNTPGTPDLLIFRRVPAFPPVAILIEEKGEGTRVEPEQAALEKGGRSAICRTVEESIGAVYDAERLMDRYRFELEQAVRIERFLKDNEGRLY